jgi:hypothetical protein
MEFRRRRRISNLVIALWLVVPSLIISAGIAANAIEVPQLSWMYLGRHIYWTFLFIFSLTE